MLTYKFNLGATFRCERFPSCKDSFNESQHRIDSNSASRLATGRGRSTLRVLVGARYYERRLG